MWTKRQIKNAIPETLTLVVALVGWASVTYGVYTVIQHPAVLYVSAGILCVGAAGWRVVLALLLDGVYAATQITHGPGDAP